MQMRTSRDQHLSNDGDSITAGAATEQAPYGRTTNRVTFFHGL